MELLSPLCFLVVVIPAFSTFYEDLFNKEEPLDPQNELRFVAKYLNEIPFTRFSFLFDTVQQFESYYIGGATGCQLGTP